MKKIIVALISIFFLLSSTTFAYAQNGRVIYGGNAGNFVFEPGTEHSLTDLFPNFKGVMPGDTLTQKITVNNKADHKVRARIFIRSLGAKEGSQEFLSKLKLKVAASKDNEMAYMFDAAANETADLSEWTYLGVLYSGGKVDLDVTLEVPTELDNEFQDSIGLLVWEFMVEELPAEEDDPKPPQTGDNSNRGLWFALMLCSGAMSFILLVRSKRDKKSKITP